MRRLIVSNVMSLNGCSEGARDIDFFTPDEQFIDYAAAMLRSTDTLVFGRATYLHMADYWPTAPPDEIADRMNSLPKIVFSRTLADVGWNNTRQIRGDAAEALARLKQAPGGNLTILGSATLSSSLLPSGLIDEYRVILAPAIIAIGKPLFRDIAHTLQFKLLRLEALRSGTVILYYQGA